MDIYPAIDLQAGQCVRLTQGDFDAVTIYEADPLRQAKKFRDAGAKWLHIVDLDGARAGAARQTGVIAAIAQNIDMLIQVGGGIRSIGMIEELFEAGVTRVVIGSLAVQNPELVRGWLKLFGPHRIVLAFDVKLNDANIPHILTHGWQNASDHSLWDILDAYSDSGLRTILCTDVARDGMLAGANHGLYIAIAERYPALEVLASGGVANAEELLSLDRIGVNGVIVGKALYEGRIDLKDSIAALAAKKKPGEAAKNAR